MIPSQNFYKLLEQLEGLKLKAYLDSAGIATIGIGTIRYPDGTQVRMGETCTKEQAYEWAKYDAEKKAVKLNQLISNITQNQFDALLLLMYNIGVGALADSTVLKRIKKGGDVREAWMMWNKARVNGKLQEVKGLTNRRIKELDLYFS